MKVFEGFLEKLKEKLSELIINELWMGKMTMKDWELMYCEASDLDRNEIVKLIGEKTLKNLQILTEKLHFEGTYIIKS